MEQLPVISVVIPNLNQKDRLEKCLVALAAQTYPRELMEVIVVDNGSSDGSDIVARSFADKFILFEEEKNPYRCRNVGIRAAGGAFIALTDSKCLPRPDWLEKGVKKMIEEEADMVAGRFVVECSSPPTISERVYRLLYLHVDPAENNQQVGGLTGNLFIRKEVFNRIGYYREDVVSGSDVEFTNRAREKGLTLRYTTDAVVSYPAKSFRQLIKSSYRDGNASRILWPEHAKLLRALYRMRPFSLKNLRNYIDRRGKPDDHHHLFQIWLLIWLVNINYGRGLLGW